MKKTLLTTAAVFIALCVFGQNENNAYASLDEIKNDNPSKKFDFVLKQRTTGNIFMTGGIANHVVKKVTPPRDRDELDKVWAVKSDGKIYINGALVSELATFNELLGKGYYSYFIADPARTAKLQKATGIIGQNEKQVPVCCQAPYVILPGGEIKFLWLKVLKTLIADNAELSKKLEQAKLQQEDVYKMFEFLEAYNKTKS